MRLYALLLIGALFPIAGFHGGSGSQVSVEGETALAPVQTAGTVNSVYIQDSHYIPEGGTCSWTAVVNGGTPPYSYQWTGQVGVGGSNPLNTGPHYNLVQAELTVEVWDATGSFIGGETIYVSTGFPAFHCTT